MRFQDNSSSRRRPAPRPTPQQIAVAREQTFKWRDDWRAEMAARSTEADAHCELSYPQRSRRRTDADNGIAQFAKAVTRAEFGRFYWSDELNKHMAKGLQKAPRNGGSGKRKRKQRAFSNRRSTQTIAP